MAVSRMYMRIGPVTPDRPRNWPFFLHCPTLLSSLAGRDNPHLRHYTHISGPNRNSVAEGWRGFDEAFTTAGSAPTALLSHHSGHAMPVELALYQPDIPQNTGTLIRLCACLGTAIHVIHPTGFAFSDARLRRAGMDYALKANLVEHDTFDAFDNWRRAQNRRLVLLTTGGETRAYDAAYTGDDILLMGRESAGVPDAVAAAADLRVRLPMAEGLRSMNVAVAAAMILGEAKRQTDGFDNLT